MARYARKYKCIIFDMNFQLELACRTTLSWADAAGYRESKLYSQYFIRMAKDPCESWFLIMPLFLCNLYYSDYRNTAYKPYEL